MFVFHPCTHVACSEVDARDRAQSVDRSVQINTTEGQRGGELTKYAFSWTGFGLLLFHVGLFDLTTGILHDCLSREPCSNGTCRVISSRRCHHSLLPFQLLHNNALFQRLSRLVVAKFIATIHHGAHAELQEAATTVVHVSLHRLGCVHKRPRNRGLCSAVENCLLYIARAL